MSRFFGQASFLAQPPGTRGAPIPRRLLWLLSVGVAGTVLFPVVYLIEGATRPGYSAWSDTISALSLGPGGWVQRLDFALCGVSVLWSALVWRRILAGGVCATWYPLLRGIEGLGLLAIAVFSTDPGDAYPPGMVAGRGTSTLGGTLHLVFTTVLLSAMCLSLLVIARRFWRQPQWRGWATFSVACALLLMGFMALFGLAQNAASPLSGYAGLFERIATNADTVWSVVLLTRLWARWPVSI